MKCLQATFMVMVEDIIMWTGARTKGAVRPSGVGQEIETGRFGERDRETTIDEQPQSDCCRVRVDVRPLIICSVLSYFLDKRRWRPDSVMCKRFRRKKKAGRQAGK